jgi:uncharacterized membrane protein
MGTTLLIHITAGSLAIIVGYVALFAAKGRKLHRRSGTWFVYAMLVMGLSGAGIAAVRGQWGSFVGGILAAYFAVTALTTVLPPTVASRRLDLAALSVALVGGVASFARGMQALDSGGSLNGVPAPMLFFFATVALLAAGGDLRAIRAGGLRGTARLARHLWRMCFALWIATGSFFLGQADELPEQLRIWPVLVTLAFLPLLVMVYWMWRVRRRPTGRTAPARGGPDTRSPRPRPAAVLTDA